MKSDCEELIRESLPSDLVALYYLLWALHYCLSHEINLNYEIHKRKSVLTYLTIFRHYGPVKLGCKLGYVFNIIWIKVHLLAHCTFHPSNRTISDNYIIYAMLTTELILHLPGVIGLLKCSLSIVTISIIVSVVVPLIHILLRFVYVGHEHVFTHGTV